MSVSTRFYSLHITVGRCRRQYLSALRGNANQRNTQRLMQRKPPRCRRRQQMRRRHYTLIGWNGHSR